MKKFVLFSVILIITLTSCTSVNNNINTEAETVFEYNDTGELVTDDIIPNDTLNEDEVISEETPDVTVNFVNNNDYLSLGITEPMNDVIKEYFTRYYSGLGSFTDYTFDDIFYFDTDYQRGIANTVLSYQNRIRLQMDIDYSFSEATVGVSYIESCETEKGTEISLIQNDYMNYGFTPDITSYTCDVEHTFVLDDMDGEYYIVSHSEISSAYNLIIEQFEEHLDKHNLSVNTMTASNILYHLDLLNDEIIDNVNEKMAVCIEAKAQFNAEPEKFNSEKQAQFPYNAEKALEYSYTWVGKYEHTRNPAFTEYDIYGGNCNNYTSQCLLNGGIPMDIYGKQWKWYGEEVNGYASHYGRSSSWTTCEYFYEYCAENTGFGLVADVEGNLFSGRPGDIIQYLSKGEGVHSVIITKVIYDSEGNVIDYLINSNTTDKVDCPMSLYGYTDFRHIKIIGYNN